MKTPDIDLLSIVDHQILRYICGAHVKTPLEFLYLETGSLPLKYIIASRRLIYLRNIHKKHDNEIIKRVYIAQSSNPTEGDYALLVKEDFKLIDLAMDESAINAMGELQYRSHIKKKHTESSICVPKKNPGTTLQSKSY